MFLPGKRDNPFRDFLFRKNFPNNERTMELWNRFPFRIFWPMICVRYDNPRFRRESCTYRSAAFLFGKKRTLRFLKDSGQKVLFKYIFWNKVSIDRNNENWNKFYLNLSVIAPWNAARGRWMTKCLTAQWTLFFCDRLSTYLTGIFGGFVYCKTAFNWYEWLLGFLDQNGLAVARHR